MLYYLSSGTDVIAVQNPNLQTHLLILIGREEGVVASPVCSSVFLNWMLSRYRALLLWH